MLSKAAAFFFSLYFLLCSAIGTTPHGYDSRELLGDPGFRNGFTVMAQETVDGHGAALGTFSAEAQPAAPDWMIAQWNSGPCLWRDRIDADPYTLTDGETKTVSYAPQDGRVRLTLNGANIYRGRTADYESPFPHLLLEQSPLPGRDDFYSCDARHILWSCDLRMCDYVPTTNPDGVNAVQFLVYFYVKGKQTNEFVWFGANLFDDRGLPSTSWARDTAGSEQMIYTIGAKETFGTARRTLYRRGVSDNWTHVTLDLAPYLDDLVQKINKENLFGRAVRRSDYYIGGMNIGFELHGNAQCSIELRDMHLQSFVRR